MTAEVHQLQQPQLTQSRSLDERLDDLEHDDTQHEQGPQWWRNLLRRDEAYAAECLARGGNIRPFTFVARGGVFTVGTNKKRTSFTEPIRISGPLIVTAGARDESGNGWSRQLEWLDREGRARSMPCSDELLHSDPSELARGLAGRGLFVDALPHARCALARYINTSVVPVRTLVRSIGWHGNDAFVLHDEVIGRGEDLVISPEVQVADAGFSKGGTFADWRRHLAAPLVGNPVPTFAMSVALSGPLIALIAGAEPFGGTLCGETSKGKTTTLRACASVWGSGAERGGFMLTWRATINGLESVLAGRNDTVLVLDELGVANAGDVGEAVYTCANGIGKARARRDGSARRTKHWRVPIISSGERTLEAKLRESDRKIQGGQIARLATIPVSRQGAFVSIPDGANAEHFAKTLVEAASTHYGHAGPLFIRWLVRYRDHAAARAEAIIAAGSKRAATLYAPMTALAGRVAHKMLVVGTAGELAIEADIIPWPEGSAMDAAISAFGDWLEESERGGAPEATTLVRAVRHFLEIYGPTRSFTKLGEWPPDHPDQSPHNRDGEPDEAAIRHYGWKERTVTDKKDENDEPIAEVSYLVKPEVLRELTEKTGFTMKAAVAELERANMLIPGHGEDRNRSRRRIGGVLVDYYMMISPY